MVEFRIDREYIGAVIGPGGKVIQEMQRQTGTTISIDEDEKGGIVAIFGPDKTALDAAYNRIQDIVFVPTAGDIFEGEIERVEDYGAFVKFKGKSGLLHVSEISYQRVENVADLYKVGDKLQVKLLENDPKTGKLRLSVKALLPKPEGYVERERPERREGGDRGDRGGRGGGGDRRGGGGGGDRRGGGGGGNRGGR
jgi:polyribonucleotide nucleotidyltransferase